VKKVLFVGVLVFVALLTAVVLYGSGYHGASGSRRTVYRVNIVTGEVTVEHTPVVGRGRILRSAPAPELEVRSHAAVAHVP
jgi:hypothetical protein